MSPLGPVACTLRGLRCESRKRSAPWRTLAPISSGSVWPASPVRAGDTGSESGGRVRLFLELGEGTVDAGANPPALSRDYVLGVSNASPQLTSHNSPRGWASHFPDEKTEMQQVEVACFRPRSWAAPATRTGTSGR